MSRRQTAESFWARVRKGRGCWEWQGATNNSGYGTVGWGGKTYTAHRLAAWLLGLVSSPVAPKNRRGPGFVLHTCDNPRCCYPGHWELGTYKKNQKDAYARRRRAPFRGERHRNAKLTNRQAAAVRRRYAAGEKQVPLALAFRVSQGAISKVVRGETYQ